MRGGNPLTDFINAVVRRFRLLDGTVLDLTNVADGEYLKRSGTTVLGDTPVLTGGSITVQEADGSPIVTTVDTLEFDNATVSNLGGGAARVTCAISATTTRVITVTATLESLQSGVAIPAGTKVDIPFDFDGTIIGWGLFADQVGSCTVDLWKDTVGNYPPTVADTITASAKPSISADDAAVSTSLPGWTTSILDGQTIRVNVDSCSTITRLVIKLRIETLAVTTTSLAIPRVLIFDFHGNGSVLTTAAKPAVIPSAPFNGTISEIYIKDVDGSTGTCTIDIYKDQRSNPTPDSGDSITGTGTKPFIAGPAIESSPQTSFTGWGTTAIAVNDEIHAVLTAVTGHTHLVMYVKVTET